MAKFSLRIVDADFYLADPIKEQDICFSEFWQADTQKVPVIRIFGATPTGQKTCLHVHQVFPYIYIPVQPEEAKESVAKQFAKCLDCGIQVALGKSLARVQHHVHKVEIVKGM